MGAGGVAELCRASWSCGGHWDFWAVFCLYHILFCSLLKQALFPAVFWSCISKMTWFPRNSKVNGNGKQVSKLWIETHRHKTALTSLFLLLKHILRANLSSFIKMLVDIVQSKQTHHFSSEKHETRWYLGRYLSCLKSANRPQNREDKCLDCLKHWLETVDLQAGRGAVCLSFDARAFCWKWWGLKCDWGRDFCPK